jgi:hypothetical protein
VVGRAKHEPVCRIVGTFCVLFRDVDGVEHFLHAHVADCARGAVARVRNLVRSDQRASGAIGYVRVGRVGAEIDELLTVLEELAATQCEMQSRLPASRATSSA